MTSPAIGRAGLTVDIRSYWLTSGGYGGGFLHDQIPLTDERELPFLPGRHLKGLIRSAFRQVPWPTERCVGHGRAETLLFGQAGRGGTLPSGSSGRLQFRNAELSTQLGGWIAADPDRREGLYREVRQTAIADGVAARGSLRSSRVVIPLRLSAEISFDLEGIEDPDEEKLLAGWVDLVAYVLPLVRNVGSGRHHGLGRSVLTLEASR